jgi:hypothetical protein
MLSLQEHAELIGYGAVSSGLAKYWSQRDVYISLPWLVTICLEHITYTRCVSSQRKLKKGQS